jgi:hypothetical protein
VHHLSVDDIVLPLKVRNTAATISATVFSAF